MKKLLPLILFFWSVTCFAQHATPPKYIPPTLKDTLKYRLPISDSNIVYQKTILVDSNIKKAVIYKRLKSILVDVFTAYKTGLQTDDFDNGLIMSKAYFDCKVPFDISGGFHPFVTCTIRYDVKDGKYRYKFYNFECQYSWGNGDPLNLSKVYFRYLKNDMPHGVLVGADAAASKYYNSFHYFDTHINEVIAYINKKMADASNDF